MRRRSSGSGLPCHLIGADDVELLAGLGIGAGMNRAVRHDDRRLVVLEQRRQSSDRRLVAGHDRDRAGKARRAQVLAQRIVGHLAPDQRVAHLARAVADAVGRRDRVLRLHEAQLELARPLADAALEARMDRFDLGQDAQIALAVALGADHADRRLVDEVRIGAELARKSDGLGRAARMAVDEHDIRVFHTGLLPTVQRVRPATAGSSADIAIARGLWPRVPGLSHFGCLVNSGARGRSGPADVSGCEANHRSPSWASALPQRLDCQPVRRHSGLRDGLVLLRLRSRPNAQKNQDIIRFR